MNYDTHLGSGCGDICGRLPSPVGVGPLGCLVWPPFDRLDRRLAVVQVNVVVKVDLGPAGDDLRRRLLRYGWDARQVSLLLLNQLAGGRLGVVGSVLGAVDV